MGPRLLPRGYSTDKRMSHWTRYILVPSSALESGLSHRKAIRHQAVLVLSIIISSYAVVHSEP